MVRKYRTLDASETQVRQFADKAEQFSSAMHLAFDSKLWDAAVSNGVHAVILMANALTGRRAGVYYADKDHGQAPEFLKQIFGPGASNAKEQMARVLNMKAVVEYEARGCTEKMANDVVKRVDRFFSWANEQKPG